MFYVDTNLPQLQLPSLVHPNSRRVCVWKVEGSLQSVTNRRTHNRNTRMIFAAVALHNLLIHIRDNLKSKYVRNDESRQQSKKVLNAFNQNWNRAKCKIDLAQSRGTRILTVLIAPIMRESLRKCSTEN